MFYLCLQLGAGLIGLAASTMLVPQNGDIGSQFFAAMLGTAALFGVPKLAHFSDLSLAMQALGWLGVAVVCGLLVGLIELNRRSQRGIVQTAG